MRVRKEGLGEEFLVTEQREGGWEKEREGEKDRNRQRNRGREESKLGGCHGNLCADPFQ